MSEKKKTKGRKSNGILGLVSQALLIVFSVLLALALNEWRAAAKKRDQAVLALSAIKSEMQQNIDQLKRAANRHERTYDTLIYYQSVNEFPPEEIYLGGLFNPADLLSTAWQTSVQTGSIEEFPYQVVLDLSASYNYQDRYSALGNSLVQASYQSITTLGPERFLKENYKNWSFITRDFAARERTLYQDLEKILAQLEQLD